MVTCYIVRAIGERHEATKKPSPKAEKVWAYLGKNKTATPAQVAKATGVSYGYAYKLMQKISSTGENEVCWHNHASGGSEKHRKKAPNLWGKLRGFFSRSDS